MLTYELLRYSQEEQSHKESHKNKIARRRHPSQININNGDKEQLTLLKNSQAVLKINQWKD